MPRFSENYGVLIVDCASDFKKFNIMMNRDFVVSRDASEAPCS
jgi:hypothetical protein